MASVTNVKSNPLQTIECSNHKFPQKKSADLRVVEPVQWCKSVKVHGKIIESLMNKTSAIAR